MADFVVAGTGRCGTAPFFRVLNVLGVAAKHESFFGLERRTLGEAHRAAYRVAEAANDVSRVPPSLIPRLERAGGCYGYGRVA